MTFIVSPGADEKIWKIVAPVCVAIAYLSPFIATYSHLTNKASWKFRPESRCFVSFSEANLGRIWKQLLIFLCISFAVSSAVNITLVVFMCKRSKRIKSTNMERSLIILALLNFLIECSFFVLFSLIFTSPYIGIDSSVSLALIPYASDILTLSNPYLLIALNRSIRSRLFRLLKYSLNKLTHARHAHERKSIIEFRPHKNEIFLETAEKKYLKPPICNEKTKSISVTCLVCSSCLQIVGGKRRRFFLNFYITCYVYTCFKMENENRLKIETYFPRYQFLTSTNCYG
ncbi:hypothetical protein RB195_017336 [Necator americanus]|uniref:Serpentine receptor class gamma n=1 Tax=Necator americanus TaxID=51031 RepID=A0ABR1C4R6_NECAM